MTSILKRIATVAFVSAAFFGLAVVAAASDSDTSPTGPFFTTEQAERGAAQYRTHCASCHGAELEGVSAPGFAGDNLFRYWDTVFEIYDYASVAMPTYNPGGLSSEIYTDIMAHILSFNGYPAGEEPLPVDPEFFKQIVIEPQD